MKRTICSLLSLLVAMICLAQEGKMYIIHSSGNVLGKGASDRAVLTSANDAKPLMLTKLQDGSVTLESDGKYLSLGTENGWSTYFVSNSTDARAHYKVETSGSYVKLKNMQTNAYLGTDDVNVGAYVYSDKNGSDTKHLWRLSDTPTFTAEVDTIAYPISIDARRQIIEGWGVSLCWWANMCGKWSDAKIDQLIDWMVSPEGLNWNIFRYNIGGGDDPNWTNCYPHHMGNGKGLRAEMEGFQDERGGEYHWERDAAQRKIMLKIKEKRPDAIFEAFSNSCPWWMTYSGCCSGNEDGGKDNLKPEYYEDFAHYLVDVCKHYKDEYGIEFKTLEPFNESVTNFWYKAGVQEGCHFDFASQVAFVKVLAPILAESGLNTVISAADETNIGLAVGGLNEFKQSGAMKYVGQWNSHTYSGDNRARSQFGTLARAEGKMVWMSETGSGGSGIAGNLSMAQRLIDDVRYIAPEAWVDWQYMEEANDQWCFVRGSFANATFSKVKNFYVRQQITRFIKKGYTIIGSLNDHSLAAVNSDNTEMVIVLLNTDMTTVHHLCLPMVTVSGDVKAWRTSEKESLKNVADFKLLSENRIEVTLPEQSITTLVIPINSDIHPSDDITDGDTYIIVPQSNASVAVSTNSNELYITNIDLDDPAQRWTFNKVSEGVYSMVNGKGQVPTSSSQYAIHTVKSGSSSLRSQQYKIEKIDGINYRIMLNGDSKKRGWDLSNASVNAGTQVGAWEYGTTYSNDHRNWFFVKVDSSDTNTNISRIADDDEAGSKIQSIYSVAGIKLNNVQPGINIVRYKNGKVKKLMIRR
ncbi:MAG: hypothetical protein KBT33_08335 [Prevotellaceae bacterium]|nr:hypothetical protein [Candidatus Minthosoma equi]